MKQKQKAPLNRTLRLETNELSRLKEELTTLHPLKKNSIDEITNKVICGDMFKIVSVLPEAFADLIIIDPPYNLSKDFSGMKFSRMKDNAYLDYLRSWFPQIVKLLKPDGSLYLCGDWKSTTALYTIMDEHLSVINRITWQREKGRGSKRNWKNSMEDIWFGVNNSNQYYFDIDSVKIRRKVVAPYVQDGKPKDWEDTLNGKFRLTHPSNLWDDITVPYWSMPENTDHPTQKPEKLIAKLILASCPPGGMVFDPFLGSGTTAAVAKKLGRNYCGIEMNPDYCCLAEKRLQNATEDKTIQGYTEGIFWERNSQPYKK